MQAYFRTEKSNIELEALVSAGGGDSSTDLADKSITHFFVEQNFVNEMFLQLKRHRDIENVKIVRPTYLFHIVLDENVTIDRFLWTESN